MDDPKAASQRSLPLPRLPVRASIYIAPDGTVHFGALFAELLPVARALGAVAADEAPSTGAVPIAEGATEAGRSATDQREMDQREMDQRETDQREMDQREMDQRETDQRQTAATGREG